MKKAFLLLSGIILFFTGFAQEKPPEVVNDTASVLACDSVSVNVLLNDWCMEGHTMEIFYIWAGNGGSVTYTDSIITFAAHYFYEGVDSVRYLVKDLDNGLLSESGYLRIEIDNPGQENLDVNNINALINSYALQFWSLNSDEHGIFEVPKGNRTHTIFNFDLWMGGLDENDSLRLAAEKYRMNGIDFWPGPVSDNYYPEGLILWNNLWKLNKTDIEYHKDHWMDVGYEPIDNINNWPAHGYIDQGQEYYMAPFNDNDGDENYIAQNGDSPAVRGDQSMFFIYNDDREEHTESEGGKIGAEIHGQAYAFDCPDDSVFNNSIFFHYDIINRSDTAYHDFCLGTSVDFDIGNYYDDYVGCDTMLHTFFAYNGDDYDENSTIWNSDTTFGYHNFPPAQGVVFLNKKMSSFVNFQGYGDPSTGSPFEPYEYYNYLTGFWKDSSHYSYGGNGYGGDTIVKFIYPGNPANPEEWSEVSAEITPDDRNGFATTGPYNFYPGDTIQLDLAFVFARDYQGDNLSSVTLLKERIETLRWFFDNDSTPCGSTWSLVSEKSIRSQSITLYPNPVSDKLYLKIENHSEDLQYEIFNCVGQLTQKGCVDKGNNCIEVSNLKNGFYLLKVKSDIENVTAKFMKY